MDSHGENSFATCRATRRRSAKRDRRCVPTRGTLFSRKYAFDWQSAISREVKAGGERNGVGLNEEIVSLDFPLIP
ncbi:hypothetical protein PUN28_007382 [Cardiocondyla obscurior]|uniref:Uncharacterized protein n=1 Tax=Cardiocondyla obscurior TaxID=286306 RepID=A0AAW2G5W5_9HYME